VKRQVERVARLVIGSIMLLIGFIGGFVPVLQGWIFVIAGLTIMAPESRRARRALDWAKSKVKREGRSEYKPADDTDEKVDSNEQ
jgi:hypothetical protein